MHCWWTRAVIFSEVGLGKAKPNRWLERSPKMRNLHRCHCLQKFSIQRVKGLSGPEIERLKKNVVKTIKDCGINIIIEVNLHTVNYLDITFDLQKDTYLHYRKPDNPPASINNCSNHPPTIIKQLPKSISKRLFDLSSNEEIFEKTTPAYSDALKKVDFRRS